MKIRIENFEEVNAAIDKVAGKAKQHVHTGPQVRDTALKLYQRFCRYLPKRLLVGSTLKLSSQPRLPKAYGNRQVIHTEVTVEICPSGLFVVDIQRCEDWATNSPRAEAWALLPEPVKNNLKSVLYAKTIVL